MPESKRVVLVVEDDHLILLNARMVLENTGCAVVEASNVDEALAMLDTHQDLAAVFTDVVMPGPLDGLALAEEVYRRRPELPIFITSGSVPVEQSALPPSASFLAKPYTAGQLTRLLA